jgi:hypothetical protein
MGGTNLAPVFYFVRRKFNYKKNFINKKIQHIVQLKQEKNDLSTQLERSMNANKQIVNKLDNYETRKEILKLDFENQLLNQKQRALVDVNNELARQVLLSAEVNSRLSENITKQESEKEDLKAEATQLKTLVTRLEIEFENLKKNLEMMNATFGSSKRMLETQIEDYRKVAEELGNELARRESIALELRNDISDVRIGAKIDHTQEENLVQSVNLYFYRSHFYNLLLFFHSFLKKHSRQANSIKIKSLKAENQGLMETLEHHKYETMRVKNSYNKYKSFFLQTQMSTKLKSCFFESFDLSSLRDSQDTAILKAKLVESWIVIEKISANYERIIELHRDLDKSQAHAEKLFLHIKFIESICFSNLNLKNKFRRVVYYCQYFEKGGLLHSLTLPQFQIKTILEERSRLEEKLKSDENQKRTAEIEDYWSFLKYTNLQQYWEPV